MARLKIENDGIDHINIYSKSKTELGRLLSNFSYSPITLKDDGFFTSIEGYWYWLLCAHPDKDLLRKEWGFKAKELGRYLNALDYPAKESSLFQGKVQSAIFEKANSLPRIQELITLTNLPFVHYYVVNGKVKMVNDCPWLMECWELIRTYFLELKEIENKGKTDS
jgi:hypothetical protein